MGHQDQLQGKTNVVEETPDANESSADACMAKRCIELVSSINALSSSHSKLHSLLVQEVEPLEPSRDALQVSLIGKRLKQLSKSESAEVASAALRISNSWRERLGFPLQSVQVQSKTVASRVWDL